MVNKKSPELYERHKKTLTMQTIKMHKRNIIKVKNASMEIFPT